MQSNNSFVKWVKQWLRPNRLVPLLTIVGAGTAIILDILKIVDLTIAEDIIISLLALIAIDSLTERLTILEKLESHLISSSGGTRLRKRGETLTPPEFCKSASEICLVGVHSSTVTTPYIGFFKSRLDEGCMIRIILLNPNSSYTEAINLRKEQDMIPFINSSLDSLKLLTHYKSKGLCEVRLLNISLPFSMLAADLSKESGLMNVQFHSYKRSIDELPHVRLTIENDLYWFNYFRKQFESAWIDASKWEPKQSGD